MKKINWKIAGISFTTLLLAVFAFLFYVNPAQVEVSGFPNLLTIEQATKKADKIVIARVTQIREAKWNTLNGKKDEFGVIFRPTILLVEETLLGTDAQEINIPQAGGKVGFTDMKFGHHLPSFTEGKEVIVFLTKDYDIGDGQKRFLPILTYYLTPDGRAEHYFTKELLDVSQIKEIITKTSNS